MAFVHGPDVAENAVPRSIFFLAWLTRDFAQNFRDARSGRDLATINRRAPWRPQRRRRKRLRSGIVPIQRRVLGTPRVVLHAPAAPRPAQGWRRTDRPPQTSVAPYVWRTPPFLPIAEMGSNRVYFVSPAVGLLKAGSFLHRRAAPERFDHSQDDPHAVRRLRHRAWLIIRKEMRPLQHALLWG